jgi:hypothetical protein
MKPLKINKAPENTIESLSPIAEQIGRNLIKSSAEFADNVLDMKSKGLPDVELFLNIGIGILCGIRTELKKGR